MQIEKCKLQIEDNGERHLNDRPICILHFAFCILHSRLLSALLIIVNLAIAADAVADETADDVVLAIHGGVGVLDKELMTPEKRQQYHTALQAALRAGSAALERPDATSLDAVVAAIIVLEDSPLFNAGKGAVFTKDGRNELDACLINGANRKSGAVANLTTIKNPIVAARIVMEKSSHVLMVGRGAEQFAAAHGAETVDPSYFRTEERWQMYQRALQKLEQAAPKQGATPRLPADSRFGTVGCVAVDRHGNLAAGTSTGGITLKLTGRVGGAPIIGAGTYANNHTCAISGTGDGEYFIRLVAAHDISALMEYRGLNVVDASRQVVHEKIGKAGGEAGVIVLDPRGRLALTYNTPGMYRGYITRDKREHVAIYEE